MKLIEWVKNNKLATVLILIVLYFVFLRNNVNFPRMIVNREGVDTFTYSTSPSAGITMQMGKMAIPTMGVPAQDMYYGESVATGSPRMVVTENFVSLQVSDVPASIDSINSQVEKLGGFMVSSNVSRPEESASGSITVRVPKDKSEIFLTSIRTNAIKVVTESIQGRDVTDQYKDIESRLNTLQSNKSRLETIMSDAKTAEEMLKVQNYIFQLQDQIDSLIGQRDYLKSTTDTVKITVYLATDEFALPYVPNTSWRPDVVFKQAVRSLIMDIRGLANRIIWLAVYAVIWVPILLLAIWAIKAWKHRKSIVVAKKK